jgi:glycosyltransferase involved in cell wall biosynthesis
MLSILTATTLFPNVAKPSHGSFVATRLEKLVASNEVAAEVLAPVPWLPPFVRYPQAGRLDLVPRLTRRGTLTVWHPRYLVVPKIGMTLAPRTLFDTMRRTLGRLIAEGKRFDLIDAHYFYPDGVAAVRLGREFGIPVVVTARGTDLSLIPDFAGPRRMIQNAAAKADGLITVCQALKDRLVELGVAPDRVTVLRNGVDLVLFSPGDRESARNEFKLTRRTLASVGWLIERKGHHHVIGALPRLPDTDLLIVGEGPERTNLERLASSLGVADRVRFLGTMDQRQLSTVYAAADALVLASSREGWANVLLEAMACGTPVVASAVWGTPEVVADPAAGVLMKTINAEGVVEGVQRLFARLPARPETRRYAEGFDWDATTQGQLRMFRKILARRSQQGHSPTEMVRSGSATDPHL